MNDSASAPQKNKTGTESEDRGLVDRPWFVLTTVFTLTGAFGIPMILLCRGFNQRQKIVWSVIAFFYTLAMIAVLIAVLVWSYRRFIDSMGGVPLDQAQASPRGH